MFKRYAVVFTLFLFAIFSHRVSAQIPIAFIIGGTLTVNGTLITHQTGSSYTFEVTRTDGTSFSPQAATAGIEETGAYIIEIPMYHSTTQPSGAHTGDSAVIHVYLNGQELNVLSPAQGQITIGQEGSIEEINLNVQAQTVPSSPSANAGPDQTVDSGAQVTLDGSASSPATSGGVLTYTWTQKSGTSVTLSSPSAVKPVFTAPTVSAGQEISLVFELSVKDPNNATAADSVTVKVRGPSENRPPEAKAGSAQTVYAGNMVTLSGSGSSDPDANEILTFLWEQTQGIQVLLSDTGAVQPTFIAPDPGQGGEAELTFMLTVTDAAGQWDSDTVTITVLRLAANRAPLANAGPDQTVQEGDTVILDGSNSTDPDNGADSGIVSWSWRQTDGTSVTLSSAGEKQARFTASGVSSSGESLIFELTVTDNGGLSGTDSVIINVV
ncbi:MAG: PKD domain-containing protein, partial [Desulfococcaceae bacterium]